jgi:hypothetical protein
MKDRTKKIGLVRGWILVGRGRVNGGVKKGDYN